MPLLLLPFIICPIIVLINFIYYLKNNVYYNSLPVIRFIEIWNILAAPVFYLIVFDLREINNCCTDSAVFSPEHRTGIYILIALSIAAYFYSTFRKKLAAPIPELLVNVFLIVGLILNVIICIHIKESIAWTFGNIPIILLFIIALNRNKQLLYQSLLTGMKPAGNSISKIAIQVLKADIWVRFPVMALLALPVLLLLSLVLFLFGQTPDTMIRAFTDTYKHGLSQLDYMCDNVQCGGHFLCSVAANGHKGLVQPSRYGERNGNKIICNRQLLIANAFEEWMEVHIPALHRLIRGQYNKVGNFIHRYYFIFNNKLVADIIYLLTKPLEWLFLLFLYTFDRQPENRISQQYLTRSDRMQLKQYASRSNDSE